MGVKSDNIERIIINFSLSHSLSLSLSIYIYT